MKSIVKIKNPLLLVLMFLCSIVYVQAQTPEYVDVDWKVGTTKNVTRIDSSRTIIDGKTFSDVVTQVSYQIKVLSYKDGLYELGFQKFEKKKEDTFRSDIEEVNSFWTITKKMLEEVNEIAGSFDYIFIVEKESGQAVEIKNELELMRKIENVTDIVFNKMVEALELEPTQEELDEAIDNVSIILSEQYEQLIQTIINDFNYVFQAYSTPFISNSIYRYETEVYDIVATADAAPEWVKIEVKSVQTKPTLTIEMNYLYDKNAYYDANFKNHETLKFDIKDFDITEKTTTVFDSKSSWIKSSESRVYVKMGQTTMHNTTLLTFK